MNKLCVLIFLQITLSSASTEWSTTYRTTTYRTTTYRTSTTSTTHRTTTNTATNSRTTESPLLLDQNYLYILSAGKTAIETVRDYYKNQINREINYRRQLYNAYNNFSHEFFNVLEYEIFGPEFAKVDSIINALKPTPYSKCASGIKDYINELTNDQARKEYDFCTINIESDIARVNAALSTSQDHLTTAYKEAERKIKVCHKQFEYNLNIRLLQSCIYDIEKTTMTYAMNILERFIQPHTAKKFLSELVACVDKIITSINNNLALNYNLLRNCVRSWSDAVAQGLQKLIPSTYIPTNKIANKSAEALEALTMLKTNPSAAFKWADLVKSFVESIIRNKNRSEETLKTVIQNTPEAAAYDRAFFKASVDVQDNSNGRACVQEAQDRFRDGIAAKAKQLKRCLEIIEVTVTVSDIDDIINSIHDRQNQEGAVAIMKCLGRSGAFFNTDNLGLCSTKGDTSFNNFLNATHNLLNDAVQKADLISKLVTSCEESIIPNFLPTQAINKVSLETCLKNNASIQYSLTGLPN